MQAMKLRFRTRRIGVILGAVAVLTASSCDSGTAINAVTDWGGGQQSPYVPDGYTLTFEDNFDQGGSPTHGGVIGENGGLFSATAGEGQLKTWETHFAGWGVRHLEGNNDQALKADAAYRGQGGPSLGEHGIQLHAFTDEGTLKLYGQPTPPDLQSQFEMPFLGGMIAGDKLHAQTYGYWEARIRMNSVTAGHHWAFWLIPSDHAWPPEIDMLEVIGSNPNNQSDANFFFFNSILSDPNNDGLTRVTPPRGKNAWYTIGFLWDETDMRWFLDGEEVRHRPAMSGDKSLYFLVTPEIGGEWVGAPTADTAWPTEAELDYIRVYRKS